MSRKRPSRRPRLDTRPPAKPHGKRAGQDQRSFYADEFTAEELALVAACVSDRR